MLLKSLRVQYFLLRWINKERCAVSANSAGDVMSARRWLERDSQEKNAQQMQSHAVKCSSGGANVASQCFSNHWCLSTRSPVHPHKSHRPVPQGSSWPIKMSAVCRETSESVLTQDTGARSASHANNFTLTDDIIWQISALFQVLSELWVHPMSSVFGKLTGFSFIHAERRQFCVQAPLAALGCWSSSALLTHHESADSGGTCLLRKFWTWTFLMRHLQIH